MRNGFATVPRITSRAYGGETPRIYDSRSQRRNAENIRFALNGGETPELSLQIFLVTYLVYAIQREKSTEIYYILFSFSFPLPKQNRLPFARNPAMPDVLLNFFHLVAVFLALYSRFRYCYHIVFAETVYLNHTPQLA
jgi:hypothetical protein